MLKLTNVCRTMDGLPVLDGFDLTVDEGEIVALIGPSGCGKTTLLNCICGLDRPDRGEIVCTDEKIGYLFQGARLLPWRTVRQNIALVREKPDARRVQELIDAVGLHGFEDYYPGQLSGGMARRCALARAFYYGGSMLLMDEPFQGLDYALRMEMLDMLLSVWRKKRPGVLFVTHEIDEALTVATRIMVLKSRPASVQKIITPPGSEGRDASDPALAPLRHEIIRQISREVKRSYGNTEESA